MIVAFENALSRLRTILRVNGTTGKNRGRTLIKNDYSCQGVLPSQKGFLQEPQKEPFINDRKQRPPTLSGNSGVTSPERTQTLRVGTPATER